MAQARKYATLPDIDTAPDIYESLSALDELALSVAPVSDFKEPLPTQSSYNGILEESIDRERIKPDRARNRFRNSQVDVKDADFSGRIGSKCKSYRVLQSRKLWNDKVASQICAEEEEEEEDEGAEEEEEEESLGTRITRLRRELEEVRSALTERKNIAVTNVPVVDITNTIINDKSLSNLSESMRLMERHWLASTAMNDANSSIDAEDIAKLTAKLKEAEVYGSRSGFSKEYSLDMHYTNTVKSLAEIEERISALEQVLGMQNVFDLGNIQQKSHRSILLSLSILESQFYNLTDAKFPSTDGLSYQIRQVNHGIWDAHDTNRLGNGAEDNIGATLQSIDHNENVKSDNSIQKSTEPLEQASRVNNIYSNISSLELMSPLLPRVIERLQTLKFLHTDASEAAKSLAGLEREQSYASEQIRKWASSLSQLEVTINESTEIMGTNIKKAEIWLKQLDH